MKLPISKTAFTAFGFLVAQVVSGCFGGHERSVAPVAVETLPVAPAVSPVKISPYGHNHALLTLAKTADGPILLDSACHTVIRDEFVYFRYRYPDRTLVAFWDPIRVGGWKQDPEAAFYTLTVPRSCRMRVRLPDNTMVWLNAESSLFFPVPFPPGERYVELKGEAFFEGAADTKRPFQVGLRNRPGTVSIVRLGSGLADICAYRGDTPAIVFRKKGPSLEAAGAWMKGSLVFSNTPAQQVMDRIRRWYDVDIIMPGSVTTVFTGAIPMDKPLPEALRLLESAGLAHFKMEKDKIIVSKN